MTMQITIIIVAVFILVGFIICGGIINGGLEKIAKAIEKKKSE